MKVPRRGFALAHLPRTPLRLRERLALDQITAMTEQLQALQALLQSPEMQAQEEQMEEDIAASSLFDDGFPGQP